MTADERFDINQENSTVDRQIAIARYLPIKKLCQELRILDLGCGNGYSSNLLLEWGASSVVGVDLDSDAILQARKCYPSQRIEFIQGYAEQIAELVNLKEFDGVCFVECIEHVIDPYVVLAGLKNGLRDDTWIYITAPNDYWSYRYTNYNNPHHLRKFTKSEFLAITSAVLGNPNGTGETHALLGFSMVPDVITKFSPKIHDNIYTEVESLDQLSSDDSIFYFAIWGDSVIEECAIGSSAPMEIYTKVADSVNLKLDTANLNDQKIRELAYKLQSTKETLTETQNQLSAVRILAESFIKSVSNSESSKVLRSDLKNINLRIWVFKRILSTPPKIVLRVYMLLPSSTKDALRTIRRRILR